MVDVDAAVGEQLFDVAVGQREAQVPAHRKDDDVGREVEAGEGSTSDGRSAGASGHGDKSDLLPLSHDRCNSAPVLTATTSPMGLVPGRRVLPEHLALIGDDHAPPSGRP
jgi:hypothetical protein